MLDYGNSAVHPTVRLVYAGTTQGSAPPLLSTVWEVAAALSQTITFTTLESTAIYGDSNIGLDATASSGLPVSFSVSSTSPATVVSSGSGYALKITGAGTIDVTASQSGGTNANGTYSPATAAPGSSLIQHITVNPASLTLTPTLPGGETSLNFGDPIPSLSYSASGVLSADQSSPPAITGTANYVITSVPGGTVYHVGDRPPSGSYQVDMSTSQLQMTGTNNYKIAYYNPLLFTVSQGASQGVQLSLGQSTAVYGGANIPVMVSSGTPVSGHSLPAVTLAVSGPGTLLNLGPNNTPTSTTQLQITGAGVIIVRASNSDPNYYYASLNTQQQVTVSKAQLTVKAQDATRQYGATDPTFQYVISGFVNNESATTANISGKPTFSDNATLTSSPGTYSLNIAVDQMSAPNYTFVPVDASLVITQASQTIDVALAQTLSTGLPLSTMTYGDAAEVVATASSGLQLTFTTTGHFSSQIGTAANVPNSFLLYTTGLGPATITIIQAGTTDYAPVMQTLPAFAVGQAPLDITAISVTREQGAPNPTFTYQVGTSAAGAVGGFQNNDTDIPSVVSGIPVLTTTATQASLAGTYSILVDTTAMTATNYYFVPIGGTLTVTPPGS